MSMSWLEFLDKIKADPEHSFDKRCELLDSFRSQFEANPHFYEMELPTRRAIAGLANDQYENWAWFGSMGGAGFFYSPIDKNNTDLSAALDEIPLTGPVNREHYNAYITGFTRVFPNLQKGIGTASRLLAMKRPDVFVCLDAKNKSELSKALGIVQANLTYKRYWDDIIVRIMNSVWWNEPEPTNKEENRAWRYRTAMLDAIFYKS